MGLFDDIKCSYALPMVGANALDYQTKDTPMQSLDKYEIREDGTLWHEQYEIEDQSEAGRWMKENPGKELPESFGMLSFVGCATRVNSRWEKVKLTGEIRFYAICEIKDGKLVNASTGGRWMEWSAYFVDGTLNQLHLVGNQLTI